MCRIASTCCWITAFLCLLATEVSAQVIIINHPGRPPIIRPPLPTPTPRASEYHVQSVEMQAQVRDQAAQVQITQIFQNTSSQTIEASVFFPLPDSAAVSGITLLVDGKELPGKLLPKAEARRIYEETVRRQRDPALLEYMGQGLYQTSVFPIPAQATRKVEIRYTQLLTKDSGMIDLVLPLGTNKLSGKPVDKLNITVRIEANDAIKTIHSPSHNLDIERPDANHAVCKLQLNNVFTPDDFRLLYGTQNGLIGMNVVSYRPSGSDDGYFLLLASPEVKSAMENKTAKTVVVVVDKSGSMSGPKIAQAREALKFVIQRLRPEDTFNIVAYDSVVETFRPELQRADEATIKAATGYADGLFSGGSTNIDGALQTALKMLNDKTRPNYVLFLTDGLPTVGEMNELNIAKNAAQANSVSARLFAFGVGFDVNSRLLDRLSREQRGQSVYVKPNENIEAQVATLYNKIGSPVLTDIAVNWEFDQPASAAAPASLSRVYPKQLTDLFQGEQLVMVGRYRTTGTAKVTLSGSISSEKRSFTFPATLVPLSMGESNGYVEKLWATRRIGEIIDELDLRGQNKELVDELVQLSLRHGILTPYTSFLADESTSLTAQTANAVTAHDRIESQLRSNASGQLGFAQRAGKGQLQNALNPAQSKAAAAPLSAGMAAPGGPGIAGGGLGGGAGGAMMKARRGFAPATNSFGLGNAAAYQDASGQVTVAESVQNVGQKTFYRRGTQWRDSSVTEDQEKKAIRVKQYSNEYFDLAAKHGGQLSKYLAFAEPILVNLGETTYQIDPADPEGT
jgi:Ca-activated chloride channel family protein